MILPITVVKRGISWGSAIAQQLFTAEDDQSTDRSEQAEINMIPVPGCSWNSYRGFLCLRHLRVQSGLVFLNAVWGWYVGSKITYCHWKYCPFLPVTFLSCKNPWILDFYFLLLFASLSLHVASARVTIQMNRQSNNMLW